MRWLVFGAGAIGTYIGGSLALQAQRGKPEQFVVFVERPEAATHIKQRGMRLNLEGEEFTVENLQIVPSLEEALELGPYDIALFALKSFDTRPALAGLTPYASQLPPFLCMQNGVENEIALAEAFGPDKVIAGTVTSSIGRAAAGDIILEKKRGIGLAAAHPIANAAAAALDAAGLNARLYPQVADMKWSKMLTNLLANATAAILDMTPVEVFKNPSAYALEVAVQREALQVMDAQNIKVVDLPGTPVRLLAYGMRYLPPAISRPLVVRFAGRGRGDKMPSFHIDLYNGRGQSEVAYLNGAVAQFGEKTGIPTPANRLLTEILTQLTLGELAIGAFSRQPEKLFNLYDRMK